ncbi:DUF2252 domain-containing protein [Nocardia mexicana]|uniref:Uncharacterized protein (DUF2252 family) n=1 Tax=Nocardia mexicana TaxID=279262 RepID=A0A370H1L1_9NOCA|nr:DUF2252 domain-containing protein [Nocardia mexicana]RDI48897.1 uncharacterized protein (DUF2252 family) [Nocardia mexicana]
MVGSAVQETQQTSAEAGKAARKRLTRSDAGVWKPESGRADPVAILERQARTRLPVLVPIRYARMMQSPFAFLRGAPAIMAADLAHSANTGLAVQLCGDAHISNFGLYASPERNLVFDVNDFDETLPGPFEWDVKRLSASVAVAARDGGFSDQQAGAAVRAAAAAYRETMQSLAAMDSLAVWYQVAAADEVAQLIDKPKQRKKIEKAADSARKRTSLQALNKLTEPDPHGVPRIKNQPPLLVPIELVDRRMIEAVFADYRRSLPDERRVLIDRYEIVDFALKVVGVGSVGTRCFVVLLQDRETGSPLFLQVKQAECSVLADHLPPSAYRHQGHRVVVGQRLMQSASDIFLGWCAGPADNWFYVRQLRDMKGSADIGAMSAQELAAYSGLCGAVLARAHARSGDRVAIAAYLGTSDVFDSAMADFASAYADQTLADQQALQDAIDSGRVRAAAEPY